MRCEQIFLKHARNKVEVRDLASPFCTVRQAAEKDRNDFQSERPSIIILVNQRGNRL